MHFLIASKNKVTAVYTDGGIKRRVIKDADDFEKFLSAEAKRLGVPVGVLRRRMNYSAALATSQEVRDPETFDGREGL